MAGPKTLEILLSEDGTEMQVTAHNFQGKGCEAVVGAMQLGNVVEAAPTAEYFQQATASKILIQGH